VGRNAICQPYAAPGRQQCRPRNINLSGAHLKSAQNLQTRHSPPLHRTKPLQNDVLIPACARQHNWCVWFALSCFRLLCADLSRLGRHRIQGPRRCVDTETQAEDLILNCWTVNGHIESHYSVKTGEWTEPEFVEDPFLRVHGMAPGFNYGVF
jgi:hypothetical protein